MCKSTAAIAMIFLSLAMSCVHGQRPDAVIQKLIDHQVIKRKDERAFRKIHSKSENNSSSSYLGALFEFEFERLFGGRGVYGMVSFTGDLSDDEKAKLQTDLLSYLGKLNASGLLADKQFQIFQKEITSDKFVHLVQMLHSVSQSVAFEQYMNPEDLKTFAHKLQEYSIVSNRYDELIRTIHNGELEWPIRFLQYCDKALIVESPFDEDPPEEYMEKIHQMTAGILPELSFTDFSFRVILDSTSAFTDSKSYDFLVSLKSNGRTYSHQSFYRLYSPDQKKYFGGGIDQQEYYKIFNKILADMQSSYRLHEVKSYEGNAVDPKRFGIIALTKEQAEMLHGGGVFFSPSYETFTNTITTARIERAIETYQQIGLLDHLTHDQAQEAKERVSSREIGTLNDVLLCFPDVVHFFDMELSNLDDPYAELVESYARISHGDFHAMDIHDDFDLEGRKWATLKFRVNGREYERKFRIDDDWIDPEFLIFMRNVATDNSLKGQFYDLYTGGQEASVIYLTREQYERLREEELAVFADEGESVEK